jgi:hypothetical protein
MKMTLAMRRSPPNDMAAYVHDTGRRAFMATPESYALPAAVGKREPALGHPATK